jgi:FtsP/CotA-like multicopper oxidase with cupredoxin domain
MVNYDPKYWLINGEAYPATITPTPIQVNAGDRLLIRYVNAGLVHHTMTLLGRHQRAIAKDAYPLTFPFDLVAETIPSGSTADMIVTIPSGAALGTRYALYNRQMRLTNVAAFPGGMMTFITVVP